MEMSFSLAFALLLPLTTSHTRAHTHMHTFRHTNVGTTISPTTEEDIEVYLSLAKQVLIRTVTLTDFANPHVPRSPSS